MLCFLYMKKNIQYMSSIQYKTRSAGLSSSCGLNRPAVGAGSPASLVVAGWPAPPMAPERASVARAQRHALPGVLRSTRAAKHKGCCKTPGCCKAHGMWCKAQGVCTGCAAKHLVSKHVLLKPVLRKWSNFTHYPLLNWVESTNWAMKRNPEV